MPIPLHRALPSRNNAFEKGIFFSPPRWVTCVVDAASASTSVIVAAILVVVVVVVVVVAVVVIIVFADDM
jgi:hypothetical protein